MYFLFVYLTSYFLCIQLACPVVWHLISHWILSFYFPFCLSFVGGAGRGVVNINIREFILNLQLVILMYEGLKYFTQLHPSVLFWFYLVLSQLWMKSFKTLRVLVNLVLLGAVFFFHKTLRIDCWFSHLKMMMFTIHSLHILLWTNIIYTSFSLVSSFDLCFLWHVSQKKTTHIYVLCTGAKVLKVWILIWIGEEFGR